MIPALKLDETPAAAAFTWRELGPADIDEIERLHHLAVGPVVRPDIVKPEHREYFESILAGRGRIVGVADGADLIGYGILQHAHSPADDPREALRLGPDAQTGRLAGASVAPAYRGRGLQRALIAARVALAPADMVLFSTAAPVNTPSWSSLLAEGFPIYDIVRRYGGYARYFMVRDGARFALEAAQAVDPLDPRAQAQMFAKGWRGFARTRLASGTAGILYGPPLGAVG